MVTRRELVASERRQRNACHAAEDGEGLKWTCHGMPDGNSTPELQALREEVAKATGGAVQTSYTTRLAG